MPNYWSVVIPTGVSSRTMIAHCQRLPLPAAANSKQGGNHVGFIMDGLEAEAYDRSYSDRALIARIIGYFRPKLPIMIVVAVLIVLNSLLVTAFPLLISNSIATLEVSETLAAARPLLA